VFFSLAYIASEMAGFHARLMGPVRALCLLAILATPVLIILLRRVDRAWYKGVVAAAVGGQIATDFYFLFMR
jgi:hypothetical protein